MPHAFRSAALIEAEAAQKKIDRLRERWASTRDSWFDGTPQSVDRRIAWIDEVISTAKSTASRLYASKTGAVAMALLPQLRADREQLVAQRDHLAGWFPGTEGDAQGFNLDPRDYPSRRDWMDASNLRSYIEHAQEQNPGAGDYHIPVRDQRLTQAAIDFIEAENTTDREELLIRAQRLMEDKTWDWDRTAAREAVRAFLGAVNDNAPVVPQQRTARAEVVQDFDDHLIFS